jgi:hypothetical protein
MKTKFSMMAMAALPALLIQSSMALAGDIKIPTHFVKLGVTCEFPSVYAGFKVIALSTAEKQGNLQILSNGDRIVMSAHLERNGDTLSYIGTHGDARLDISIPLQASNEPILGHVNADFAGERINTAVSCQLVPMQAPSHLNRMLNADISNSRFIGDPAVVSGN